MSTDGQDEPIPGEPIETEQTQVPITSNRIPTYEELRAFWMALQSVWREIWADPPMPQQPPQQPPPPGAMLAMLIKGASAATSVSKGSDVLYHDPITGEACTARVVKIVQATDDPGRPKVNLVYWQEEGPQGIALGVRWGAGSMGRYWVPGRDDDSLRGT